jgi:hypothetical protein
MMMVGVFEAAFRHNRLLNTSLDSTDDFPLDMVFSYLKKVHIEFAGWK